MPLGGVPGKLSSLAVSANKRHSPRDQLVCPTPLVTGSPEWWEWVAKPVPGVYWSIEPAPLMLVLYVPASWLVGKGRLLGSPRQGKSPSVALNTPMWGREK